MADTEQGFTFSEDEFSTALAEALRYFKYGSLKVEQIECLRRVICLREDVLAVLPTGFGKSLKWYCDENHIFPIEPILKHKQVACMTRKMLFTIFKYLFSFQRYLSF